MVDTLSARRHVDRMAHEKDTIDPSDSATEGVARRAWVQGSWWLPVTLVLAVVIFVWMSTRPPEDAPPDESPPDGAVSLVVEFGDNATREFADLPWRDGMTIADLMLAVADSGSSVEIDLTGHGEMTFLQAIDGIEGEDGAGGRNWIVRLNGEKCQRGIGATQLQPGDAVLWKYEPYE